MDYIYIMTYRYPWENSDDELHRYDFKVQKKETEVAQITSLNISGMIVAVRAIIKLYSNGTCVAVKGA